MLKKGIQALALLAVLSLLAGCRVVWVDESLAETPPDEQVEVKGNEVIELNAKIQFDPNRLIVRGTANLPPGSVISADLKEYPAGVEQEDILNGMIEPAEEIAHEKQVEINEDGTFLIVLDRPDAEKRYQAALRFAPEIQTEAIQEKFGESGEMIGDSEGIYEYESNGSLVTGIAKYAPVFSLSDGGWYRGKFDMYPKIEDARPTR
ncbi:hypothetical protein ACOJQI_22410 [Bacillus salacetis]|uniref:hypothetical protein n=1 Tax=Bacillus salacetis TaxID=2315464 RepID=UPI003B9F1EA7